MKRLGRRYGPHPRERRAGELKAARQLFVTSTERELGLIWNKQERRVLRLRLGLDGLPPFTLKEVGQELEVSSERARQIESLALRKLRRREESDEW